MLKTLWATVQKGKIELLETWELPEGTKVLVTLISPDTVILVSYPFSDLS